MDEWEDIEVGLDALDAFRPPHDTVHSFNKSPMSKQKSIKLVEDNEFI